MEAKIFIGSQERANTESVEIKNPYTKKVVSRYYKCSSDDAHEALIIAKIAKKRAKIHLYHKELSGF